LSVWLLVFVLGTRDAFVAGEYQSEQRCVEAAQIQAPHWRQHYKNKNLMWRCEHTWHP
jgi:hypothetical protein